MCASCRFSNLVDSIRVSVIQYSFINIILCFSSAITPGVRQRVVHKLILSELCFKLMVFAWTFSKCCLCSAFVKFEVLFFCV